MLHDGSSMLPLPLHMQWQHHESSNTDGRTRGHVSDGAIGFGIDVIRSNPAEAKI